LRYFDFRLQEDFSGYPLCPYILRQAHPFLPQFSYGEPSSLGSEDPAPLMLHLKKQWGIGRSQFLTLWISLASLIFFLAASLRHKHISYVNFVISAMGCICFSARERGREERQRETIR
jgi:hypothetical protein